MWHRVMHCHRVSQCTGEWFIKGLFYSCKRVIQRPMRFINGVPLRIERACINHYRQFLSYKLLEFTSTELRPSVCQYSSRCLKHWSPVLLDHSNDPCSGWRLDCRLCDEPCAMIDDNVVPLLDSPSSWTDQIHRDKLGRPCYISNYDWFWRRGLPNAYQTLFHVFLHLLCGPWPPYPSISSNCLVHTTMPSIASMKPIHELAAIRRNIKLVGPQAITLIRLKRHSFVFLRHGLVPCPVFVIRNI
eukprot:284819661_2